MQTIQPPKDYPFKPGEAVFFLPNSSRWGKPIPYIPATVIDYTPFIGHWDDARIQRDDKPRTQKARCVPLAYRGYCATCLAPAVVDSGALRCPACGDWALDEPPPDALIVRWFPIDCWHTAMEIRRAFEHPDWTRSEVSDNIKITIERAYTAALTRLALPALDYRSTEDFEGWRRDYDAIERMRMYAILNDDAAFLAAYQKMQQDQQTPAPSRAERMRELLKWVDEALDELPPSRRLDLPPTSIVRPADDSQPDDADELTAWLEQQFRRAA